MLSNSQFTIKLLAITCRLAWNWKWLLICKFSWRQDCTCVSELRKMSRSEHMRYRAQMLQAINGDTMPPFLNWPYRMRELFHMRHQRFSNMQVFKLILFFAGNGAWLECLGEWIISSYVLHRSSTKDIEKRIEQLLRIMHKICKIRKIFKFLRKWKHQFGPFLDRFFPKSQKREFLSSDNQALSLSIAISKKILKSH